MLTLREIGKQLGVSRSASYNHFRDKPLCCLPSVKPDLSSLGKPLRRHEKAPQKGLRRKWMP